MKKQLLSMLMLVLVLFTVLPTASHAAHANGTYDVSYQVNKPSSSDASIANDYFLKPAKVTVNDGAYTVQLTIKNSSWVSEFNPPGGGSVVASNPDADTRTIRFTTSSIERVTISMKIDIDDIDYHHAYSVDFLFDVSAIPTAQATTSNTSNASTTNEATTNTSTSTSGSSSATATSNSTETVVKEENPQTSDTLPYSLFVLLVASAFFMIRTKTKY